ADGERLGIEALSLAARAAHHAHVLLQLQAAWPRGCLLEAAQQLWHNPFPLAAVLPHAAATLLPFVGDMLLAGAIEQQVLVLRRQVPPWRFQIDAESLRHALVDVFAPAAHAAHPANQRNRTLIKAQL